ncbi:hypothetical protein RB614_27070 [Phytohabitans sp. ZYX-F-186]|uniref:Uncharacterized protein n=1 Tax=Phytohabitans maris TaxID=3071409 RepID=A0ABU0ZMC7_9ACTN|nr:hypothetical protein [Phytohabitans sp. ZYX-F-186]MDQ7908193.1 hypothetical protein [Phytohabitans sp. ZYX-F-186]
MIATSIRVSALLPATLLWMGACGQGDPPPPAGAVDGLGEGLILTSAQPAVADLGPRLSVRYDGPRDTRWYRLPAGTTWEPVVAHHARELGAGWSERD